MRDDKAGLVWLIVCGAVLASAAPVAAQTVTAGVKAGVVAARLSASGAGAFETAAKAGPTGGGFAAVGVSRYLRLQVEALYAERRFRSSGLPIEVAIRSRGLELPLLLQVVASPDRRVRPLAFAGPQVSVVSNVTQVVFAQSSDISDEIVNLDMALTVGVGLEIAAGAGAVVVDARGVFGLKELNEAPPPEFRSRAFSVLVGYRF